MWRLVLIAALFPAMSPAETLLSTRTLRSQIVLGPGDLVVAAGDIPGTLSDPAQAIGMETRVILYAGRPIRPGDIGPPAIIDRNQIVTLRYQTGGLMIQTDARALDRAAVGDRVRVMNLDSRTTVTGQVTANGDIVVGPAAYE